MRSLLAIVTALTLCSCNAVAPTPPVNKSPPPDAAVKELPEVRFAAMAASPTVLIMERTDFYAKFMKPWLAFSGVSCGELSLTYRVERHDRVLDIYSIDAEGTIPWDREMSGASAQIPVLNNANTAGWRVVKVYCGTQIIAKGWYNWTFDKDLALHKDLKPRKHPEGA